jgi:ABC-2 type transport system permease protein
VTAYLGLVLLGSCFIAMGLFVSSLTRNQVVAGVVTFGLALFLWVISWLSSFSTGTMGTLATYLSLIDHFDDFSKGVIDTTHLAYYLSFITFGLFLTAKSVDSERWRG